MHSVGQPKLLHTKNKQKKTSTLKRPSNKTPRFLTNTHLSLIIGRFFCSAISLLHPFLSTITGIVHSTRTTHNIRRLLYLPAIWSCLVCYILFFFLRQREPNYAKNKPSFLPTRLVNVWIETLYMEILHARIKKGGQGVRTLPPPENIQKYRLS